MRGTDALLWVTSRHELIAARREAQAHEGERVRPGVLREGSRTAVEIALAAGR